jgi:hypothetical protein
VVVALLRGFGRKMLTRYAFGQKLLTCSAHNRGDRILQVSAELSNLHQAIMSLRAFEEFALPVHKVTVWSGIDDVDSHTGHREP